MALEHDVVKMCQVCGMRAATHYVCNANNGGAADFCEECYKASLSVEQLRWDEKFAAAIGGGKCQYCGAPAAGGAGSWSPVAGLMELAGLSEGLSLWCEECARDLQEFGASSGYAKFLEQDFPFDDEAAILKQAEERERFEEAQREFMRRRVLERGGGEGGQI